MTHHDPARPDQVDPRIDSVADRAGDAEPSAAHELDLSADLRALDADLDRLLGDSIPTDADLVRRVFEASRIDLPPRIIPISTSPARRFRRIAAGFGAIAAAVAVAVFAGRLLDDGRPTETGRTLAGTAAGVDRPIDPMDDLELLEPRDSELMLVAVLDPDESWFDEDPYGIPLDAEPILRSRAFGVDELEGAVFAMLGGPTS